MYYLHRNGSPEATEELLSLASGPSFTNMVYSACIVNGVRFVAKARDEKHKTQNSGISVPGIDGNMFYGVLEEIIELTYLNKYNVTLFKCKWYDTDPTKKKLYTDKNITSISINGQWYKDDPYILATQAKQVFYIEDLLNGPNWRVVHNMVHRDIWDLPSDGDNAQDLLFLQDSNSSNFNLTVDLGDFDLVHLGNERNSPSIVPTHRNVGLGAHGEDTFIDDDESLEDETIDDYMDEEPTQSDNEGESDDHESVRFTDTDSEQG